MSAPLAIQIAATFIWLGMVLAISFLEAPLKFRAPGITVPLGVGIGRLVFRALNAVETGLALVIVAAVALRGGERGGTVTLVVLTGIVLALGAAVLRPKMDRRVLSAGPASEMPRSFLHVGYIVLEVLKVVLLIVLGIAGLRAA